MEKNILLTTLSKKNPKLAMNLYYDAETKQYCSGILQMEAGAKAILGSVPIDHIVAIGSNETFDEKDKKEWEDLADESAYRSLREACGESREAFKKASVLTCFAFRLAEFLREEGTEEAASVMLPDCLFSACKEGERTEKQSCQDGLNWWIERMEKTPSDIWSAYRGDWEKLFAAGKQRLREEGILPKTDTASEGRIIRQEDVIYYLYRRIPSDARLHSIRQGRPVSFTFIPEHIKSSGTNPSAPANPDENVLEIIRKIRDIANEKNTADNELEYKLNLYIDMQGGTRTDGYIRNAVLSILHNDTEDAISIQKVVATNFAYDLLASPIIDETRRYRISDLAAGMNAFLRYGKADLIQKYISEQGTVDANMKDLVDAMQEMDDALSLSNVDRLIAAIDHIRIALNAPESPSGSYADNIWKIVKEEIQRDYSPLLEDQPVDIVKLIDWAQRKGFVQQALTVAEAYVPRALVRTGMLGYCILRKDGSEQGQRDAEDRCRFLWMDFVSEDMTKQYKFEDVDHYFLRELDLGKPDPLPGGVSMDSVMDEIRTDLIRELGEGTLFCDTQGEPAVNRVKVISAGLRCLPEEEPSEPRRLGWLSACGPGDRRRLIKVLTVYCLLAQMRNKSNHAVGNEIPSIREIRACIDLFVREYRALYRDSEERLKNYVSISFTPDRIRVLYPLIKELGAMLDRWGKEKDWNTFCDPGRSGKDIIGGEDDMVIHRPEFKDLRESILAFHEELVRFQTYINTFVTTPREHAPFADRSFFVKNHYPLLQGLYERRLINREEVYYYASVREKDRDARSKLIRLCGEKEKIKILLKVLWFCRR